MVELKNEKLKKFRLLCDYYIEVVKEGFPIYMYSSIKELEDELFQEEYKKDLEVFKMVFKDYLCIGDLELSNNVINIEKLFKEQLVKMKEILIK